jgi:hypothetical protein
MFEIEKKNYYFIFLNSSLYISLLLLLFMLTIPNSPYFYRYLLVKIVEKNLKIGGLIIIANLLLIFLFEKL